MSVKFTMKRTPDSQHQALTAKRLCQGLPVKRENSKEGETWEGSGEGFWETTAFFPQLVSDSANKALVDARQQAPGLPWPCYCPQQ